MRRIPAGTSEEPFDMLEPDAVNAEPPFAYGRADYEEVPCNLCGSRDVETVANRDRNGLRVRSVICRRCGLIFISPRMTAAWYGWYYELEYRRQMSRFRGIKTSKANLEKIHDAQIVHGAWVIDYLRKHDVQPPKAVLDVGSSTGGVLRKFKDEFGAEVIGVEPSLEEGAFAQARGVRTHLGMFEDFNPGPNAKFDLILCMQTFNHLLDPRRVAEQVRRHLKPNSVFFLECQNFFHVCRMRSAIVPAVQIDHVFMFVPATLKAMLEMSGLAVLPGSLMDDSKLGKVALRKQKSAGIPWLHVRMLARPTERSTMPSSSYASVKAELDILPNFPLRAWLRQRLPRVKRQLRGEIRRHAGRLFKTLRPI